ncbi:MAG TPA: HAD family phosphatase [Dehalococcoidia bacterium]|jgi:putative hydrolase of the HAD superfamily|nr:HAD family phosphatase [Dehalococcoidia bacterium]
MGDYRAVIFDFGGVLTSSPVTAMRSYCERSGVPWEQIRVLLAGEEAAWSRWETNTISQDEFVREFEEEARRAGVQIDGASFLQAFFTGMALRPEMVAVVRALRRRGDLKIGCITNNTKSERRRNPLFDELFEVVVESSVVGMRKPDPRIYLHACALLGVQPQQAIFLDDLGVNLKAARSLGMATIKVDETASAIDELEGLLGFPLPRGETATA